MPHYQLKLTVLVPFSSCPLYCVLVVDEHIVATGDEDGTVKVSRL